MKPWDELGVMKLTRTLTTIGIAVLALTGCSAEDIEAAKTEQEDEPQTAEEAAELITVPDVTGMPLDEAKDELKDLELQIEEEDASGEDRTAWSDKNWTVIEQTPAADDQVEPETELILSIEHEDDEEEPTDEPTEEERRETDAGLDTVHAQVACTTEAENQAYPDNLKVHTVMGKIQETIDEEEIRFLWEITLESAAGGKQTGEILCIATGDNDSTQVQLEFR